MHYCAICQDQFSNFPDYHEHLALHHAVTPCQVKVHNQENISLESNPRPIGSGPIALKQWTGPMDKVLKAKLVEVGERRIGKEYFYGYNGL